VVGGAYAVGRSRLPPFRSELKAMPGAMRGQVSSVDLSQILDPRRTVDTESDPRRGTQQMACERGSVIREADQACVECRIP
jgi:hypothetical protein